ncbi:MAG: DinB family protein, partial [Ilumatobacteraceae bacterium]
NSLMKMPSGGRPAIATTPVDGEWTLVETLRHLVFAMDKWIMWPLLGDRSFTPIGLPNTGSQSLDWPGLDPRASTDLATVLEIRRRQHERFRGFISDLDVAALPETVEVPENGEAPTMMCVHAVLEEEFEHLRYMVRDLARLGLT